MNRGERIRLSLGLVVAGFCALSAPSFAESSCSSGIVVTSEQMEKIESMGQWRGRLGEGREGQQRSSDLELYHSFYDALRLRAGMQAREMAEYAVQAMFATHASRTYANYVADDAEYFSRVWRYLSTTQDFIMGEREWDRFFEQYPEWGKSDLNREAARAWQRTPGIRLRAENYYPLGIVLLHPKLQAALGEVLGDEKSRFIPSPDTLRIMDRVGPGLAFGNDHFVYLNQVLKWHELRNNGTLHQKILNGFLNRMGIGDERRRLSSVFQQALVQSGGDPIAAFGLLSFLSIIDAHQAQAQGWRDGNSVFLSRMVPIICAPDGAGSYDAAGQLYHFWGYQYLMSFGLLERLEVGVVSSIMENLLPTRHDEIDLGADHFAIYLYSIFEEHLKKGILDHPTFQRAFVRMNCANTGPNETVLTLAFNEGRAGMPGSVEVGKKFAPQSIALPKRNPINPEADETYCEKSKDLFLHAARFCVPSDCESGKYLLVGSNLFSEKEKRRSVHFLTDPRTRGAAFPSYSECEQAARYYGMFPTLQLEEEFE